MTSRFSVSLARIALASLAALPLASCAIGQPPTITHRSAMPNTINDVEFVQATDASGLRAEFAGSLENAFASQGVAAKIGSRWVADFAVASYPSTVSTVPVGDEASGVDPSKTNGFKAKWYHKCRPEQVRGSLVIFDRQTNALAAKSEGHFVACPGDRDELDALAALLVRSAMNDAATPTP